MFKHIFIFFIKFYQKFLSPLKRPCCRFYPSCSQYALTAFNKHSIFKALFLTVRRLLKCHPFSKGGYDPVP